MLEPKDLEMISSLFHQNLQPLIDVNNIVGPMSRFSTS